MVKERRSSFGFLLCRGGLVWLLVSLVLAGCGGEAEEFVPLPPFVREPRGALVMSAETAATISLRGLPPEIVVDEAGQIVVAAGLENVGVGTYVLLEGGGAGVRPEAIASYRWQVQGPPNSTAAFADPAARFTTFLPDVVGPYTITLTIGDGAGVIGRPADLRLLAGTWVGAGIVAGASDHPSQCIECHDDKVATWRGTRHSETLHRAMDGQASPFYFENCIHCHTVGKNEIADNGGFDDVARELGWTYPEELRPGNYARLVAEAPRLANLANTQCENCHGPGSAHEDDDGNIAFSLRPELCIQCHDFLQQDRHAQWVRSGHADTSLPHLFPDGIDDPVCSGCHTTRGMIAVADGLAVEVGGDEYLSCQACHDPHAAPGSNVHQLRFYGSIALPDGTHMANVGSSATCIQCHNVVDIPHVVEEEGAFLPPQSAAAEMLAGVGGYTFGETLTNSPHVNAFRWGGGCVGCHMVSASGEGAGDFLSATMNEPVGEHTFLVRWDNGTPDDPSDDIENLRACAPCHGDIPRLNGPAAADYDGDGVVGDVQDEVQGLLDLVRRQLMAAGVAWQDEAPYWGPAEGIELRAGVYNWSYVNNDGSGGMHNTARAVELLQLTYERLAGEPVPGAVLRAAEAPAETYRQRYSPAGPLADFFGDEFGWVHVAIPLALLGLLAAVVVIAVTARRRGSMPS
jgi:hypothetical protein